ncbi:MAG: hypothetical protein IK068_04205 [Lachnospiraceae bacterium]|nr:hypothetical protein [Lachnospiraceae bacterium]
MTDKDKKTVIIAVIALLIFGIAFLGIRPAITGLKEERAKNVELSAQKEAMQTEINSLPTYKTNLETAKTNYNATAARAFADLPNDKIHDVVIDEIVKPTGLTVSNFRINNIDPMGILQYAPAVDGVSNPSIAAGTTNLASISVDVSGTQEQVIALVDKLNATEGTFLQSVAITNSGEVNIVNVPFYMVLSETFE